MAVQHGLEAASFEGYDFEINSFVIAGEDRSANIKGLGTPSYAVSESVLAGVRGTRFNQALMRKRQVTLELICTANNAEEYFIKRQGILTACNKENGVGELALTIGGNDYVLSAVPEPPEIGSPEIPLFGVLLQFFCYDPIIYGGTEVETADIMAPGGGGFVFPIVFPITFSGSTATGRVTLYNEGNVASYPRLTLRGGLTNPVIQNETTGEYFKLNYTIAEGREVVVDLAAKTAILDGVTNLAEHIDAGATWWPLAPGQNSVRLTTDQLNDTGVVVVRYVPAWGQL